MSTRKEKLLSNQTGITMSQAVDMLKKILKYTEKNPSSLEYLKITRQEGDSSTVKLTYNTNVMSL